MCKYFLNNETKDVYDLEQSFHQSGIFVSFLNANYILKTGIYTKNRYFFYQNRYFLLIPILEF